MSQMHVVAHMAFFIVMDRVVESEVLDSSDHELEDHFPEIILAYRALKWGHLGMVISQLLSIVLKKFNFMYISQTISIAGQMSCYYIPFMYALYIYKVNIAEITKDKGLIEGKSEILVWIIFELLYFWIYFACLVIFMFTAYIRKYKTMWKNDSDPETEHAIPTSAVWNNKSSDDFLRYFKYEAFTFGHYGTQLWIALGTQYAYY